MEDLKHTPGPWSCDDGAHGIWAPSEKGGETKIFDIRGWGYLTGNGHGALGLPFDKAEAIQRANGKLAASAPEMLAALQFILPRILGELHPDHPEHKIVVAAIAKATGQ